MPPSGWLLCIIVCMRMLRYFPARIASYVTFRLVSMFIGSHILDWPLQNLSTGNAVDQETANGQVPELRR